MVRRKQADEIEVTTIVKDNVERSATTPADVIRKVSHQKFDRQWGHKSKWNGEPHRAHCWQANAIP
jgi:hypothetical protein